MSKIKREQRLAASVRHTAQEVKPEAAPRHFLLRVTVRAANETVGRAGAWGRGYKNRGKAVEHRKLSVSTASPGRDAVTPPSVALRQTGSRQGNRGPPLPPPLIGCLCWLRHTGLAGPAPRAGQWRRLLSCRSAAESRRRAWSPPPPGVWWDCWVGGAMSEGGRTENHT